MKNIILFLLIIGFVSCSDKEPNNPEDQQINGLEGWDISKSNYDFNINPRDIFFINPNIGTKAG